MATHISIVNNIMRRIREDTVSRSTDSSYAVLVSEIVAQAYEEVLDEWDWKDTFAAATYAIPPSVYRHNLSTNKPNTPPPTVGHAAQLNSRSRIIREHGRSHVYTSTDGGATRQSLRELTLTEMAGTISRDTDATSLHPDYFSVDPRPNGDMEVVLYPAAYPHPVELTILFYDRPPLLESDGTTDNVVISIPFRPVQELAMLYVLNERGEEIGEPGNLAERRYAAALTAARASDIEAEAHTNVYDWSRD